jgi:RHS repeat-associated protein
LYNGNISSSSVYQKKFDYANSPGGALIFYNYRYDQLNRLTAQDAFNGFNSSSNSWSGITSMNENLKERIAYDANGNIKKYLRKSITGTTADMDSLNYYYYANTNRLRRITDSVPASAYVHPDNRIIDIDGQPDNNYGYDAIGNLIKDSAEKITGIKWNVYGKIEEINRVATTAAPAANIKYTYDAMGNRISQVVTSGGTKYYTWYVRDAQGNIMSTYTTEGANSDLGALTLKLSQYFLYGSSRLGLVTVDDDNVDGGPDNTAYYYNERNFGYDRGYKEYELTNHLGNVLATISDRKFGVTSGSSSLIDHYDPHIITAQDYYPFGMLSRVDLPGSGKSYKFGFNGKLNDNEVKGGLGNQQDYGFRIYDPRIGKFLSVDPLTKEYPWYTPYQFAGNKPIRFVDIDGLEEGESLITRIGKYGFTAVLTMTWDDAKNTGYDAVDGFNRTSNPAGILAHGVYGMIYKEDLITKEPKGRLDAFNEMGFNGIVLLSGERLFTGFSSTSKLEAQMAKNATAVEAAEKAAAKNGTTASSVKQVASANGGNVGYAAPDARATFVQKNKGFANWGMEFLDDAIRTVEQPVVNYSKNFMSSATNEWGQGLSIVGRALQKHAGRIGSRFAGIKFSHKTANEVALNELNKILKSNNQIIQKAENGGTLIFDKTTGRGFGVSREGLFNGFRDLPKN